MFDESVQIFRGIGIQRRRQNAAIAKRARAKLHAAVHPRHDAIFGKLRNGRRDHLFGGQDVAEAAACSFRVLA